MRLDGSRLVELRGCGNADRVRNRAVVGVNKSVYKV